MPLIYLTISTLISFLITLTPLDYFFLQITALATIGLLFYRYKFHRINPYLLGFIICLVVFSTHGLSSPVFFLLYFYLFIIAFSQPPFITLSYSLILCLFLSQTLNSTTSLLSLLSLPLITPITWMISYQYLQNLNLSQNLAASETDFFLWLSLKFKTGITQILDTTSELLSQPQLTPTQKNKVHFLRDSAKSLLNSAEKLIHHE